MHKALQLGLKPSYQQKKPPNLCVEHFSTILSSSDFMKIIVKPSGEGKPRRCMKDGKKFLDYR